jgi:hypothetical protein
MKSLVYLKLCNNNDNIARNSVTDIGLKSLFKSQFNKLLVLLMEGNLIKEPKSNYLKKDLFLFY